MLFTAVDNAQFKVSDTLGDAFNQQHSTLLCSYAMHHPFIFPPFSPSEPMVHKSLQLPLSCHAYVVHDSPRHFSYAQHTAHLKSATKPHLSP